MQTADMNVWRLISLLFRFHHIFAEQFGVAAMYSDVKRFELLSTLLEVLYCLLKFLQTNAR
jgi:hypothetical protein